MVETEGAVRALVTEVLGSAGYAPLGAASLHEARALLADGRFELVIAAARLVDGAGSTLAGDAAGGARLLLVGGDAEAARTAGAAWLPRPFTASKLRRGARATLGANHD